MTFNEIFERLPKEVRDRIEAKVKAHRNDLPHIQLPRFSKLTKKARRSLIRWGSPKELQTPKSDDKKFYDEGNNL